MARLSSLARASAPKAETTSANVAFCKERSESIEYLLFGAHRWCRQGEGRGPARFATLRPGPRGTAGESALRPSCNVNGHNRRRPLYVDSSHLVAGDEGPLRVGSRNSN